jgi:beta-N-acetylglucosaminidase
MQPRAHPGHTIAAKACAQSLRAFEDQAKDIDAVTPKHHARQRPDRKNKFKFTTCTKEEEMRHEEVNRASNQSMAVG